MIQLRDDCFFLRDDEGRTIPCSAEEVTIELLGGASSGLDKEWLRHAAAGVLHYFKTELGREFVTVSEFAAALSKVLNGMGLAVAGAEISGPPADERVVRVDLRALATECDKSFELGFYNRLRAAVTESLQSAPAIVECEGLRGCVKQLAGRQRWCDECRGLEEQILSFLQKCFHEAAAAKEISLLVR